MFFSLVFDMSACFRRSYQAFILPQKKKENCDSESLGVFSEVSLNP